MYRVKRAGNHVSPTEINILKVKLPYPDKAIETHPTVITQYCWTVACTQTNQAGMGQDVLHIPKSCAPKPNGRADRKGSSVVS